MCFPLIKNRGNLSKETERIKKGQTEILKWKNTISKIKMNVLNQMQRTEERVSKLENRWVKIT